MTNQEAKKILQRDLEILIENKSLPDGIEAMRIAISALGAIEQFRWERDVAISQLEELGLNLGQKVDHVRSLIDKEKMTLAEKELHKNATLYVNGANDFAKYIKETYDKESVYAFEIEDILTQFLQQFEEVNKISK